MSENRPDRRIRKTRAALRRCLSALLLKKSVKDINVREFTELADINRGTFYLHCHDVFGLLGNLEEEIFLQFTALLERHGVQEVKGSPRKLLTDLLYFVQKNADLFRILPGVNDGPHFLDQLRVIFREEILVPWQATIGGNSSYEYEYFYSYVIDDAIDMMYRWVENDTDLSPENMFAFAERSVVFGSSTLLPSDWTLTRS